MYIKFIMLLILLVFIGCKEDATPPNNIIIEEKTNTKKIINNLTYENSNIQLRYQVDIFVPYYPTYYGSKATNFSISPALPQGLYFSSLSGRIAGTPEELLITPKKYTITASNEYGSASTEIYLQVIHQAPFGLRYNSADISLITKISEISLVAESSSGYRGGASPTSYTISPSLPNGLSFDTLTGTIEGIPENSFPKTSFTITANNSGGSVSTTLNIESKSILQDIQLGENHTCAQIDNQIKCWGDNSLKQVDNSNNQNLSIPTQVPYQFSDIRNLITGSDINCVIQLNSQIHCWGNNKDQFLGNTFPSILNSPTFIDDLVIFGSLSKYNANSPFPSSVFT